MGALQIAALRKGAALINFARAELVDSEALAARCGTAPLHGSCLGAASVGTASVGAASVGTAGVGGRYDTGEYTGKYIADFADDVLKS